MHKKKLVNQSITTFFHCDLPVFPLILTQTLVECPLIQLPFYYFPFSNAIFFGAEIYKLKTFIRKNKSSRNFKKLVICENMYSQNTIFFSSRKLVHLRHMLYKKPWNHDMN